MTDFPRPLAGDNAGDGSPLVLGDDSVVGEGPNSSATALWTWARHGSNDLHIPECYPVVTLGEETDTLS